MLPFEIHLEAPVVDALVALSIAVVINLIVLLGKRVARRSLARIAERTESALDDAALIAVGRIKQWLIFPISLYAGAHYLSLSAGAMSLLKTVAVVCAFLQVGLLAAAVLEFYLDRTRTRAASADIGATTGLAALAFIGRVAIWSLMLLLMLTNLGIDVTAFVAGLGVGGIAVALAVQNILGDLFASLSIVLDKPFMVGDFIIVDDCMGTVEQVGLKTTRIRSLSGEQLVMSNGDLLKARLRNYKRMRERRVVMSFGVLYQTTADQLEGIPQTVRAVVERHDQARFDRAHLMRFGDSSLDYEVVYWVLDPDYNVHMDIQQSIHLGLIRAFEKDGISFAFPTRTVILEGAAASEAPTDVGAIGPPNVRDVHPHGRSLS